jgi:murein DD-endopeptidase MepM/ murein hydrolase activator NlpD
LKKYKQRIDNCGIILIILIGLLNTGFLQKNEGQNSTTLKNVSETKINQNLNSPTTPCSPEKVSTELFSPFIEENRNKFTSIKNRIIGKYGDYRSSPLMGHRHAGIDLKGDFSENVYPIGSEKVKKVFRSFPHKTVVIKHYLANDDSLYSSYTHVEDIKVEINDWVNEDTALARLFTKEE